MKIDKYRAHIKSQIWKTFAQSGVDLKALSSEDQTRLVDALAEDVLVAMNDILDDVDITGVKGHAQVDLEDDEVIIWEGRPFMSLVEYYTITNERIKIEKGLLGKDIENFELIRVQDIDVTKSMGERMMGIGDITISGADSSNPTVILRNVRKPDEVYELLRKAWLAARKKYNLIFREEM